MKAPKPVVECTYDYMGRQHTRKVSVRWFLFWDPTQPEAYTPAGHPQRRHLSWSYDKWCNW